MTFGRAALLAVSLLVGGCALERTQALEKSMEPTILSGEMVKVDRDAYADAAPRVGDIVELRAPAGVEEDACGVEVPPESPCPRPTRESSDSYVVKRVAALPGERISIGRRGEAVVNGRVRDLGPVIPCAELDRCELSARVRVPAGHYFVLGDNRPYSSDSRHWGPVPRDAIEGRVTPPDPSRR